MRDDRPEADVRTEDDGDGPAVGGESEDVDAVFDVLSDERRRCILGHVVDGSDEIGFEELADRIYDRDHGSGGVGGWDDRNRIRCSLYHVHLPKLDEAGIVEFDRSEDTVRPSADGWRMDLCCDLMAHAGR